MATKKGGQSSALQKLKSDLAQGAPERLYVFYGEESYLKEYYRSQLVALGEQGGFGDFNVVILEGALLSADALTDAVESMPMGQYKTVVVRDYPLMKPTAALKESLPQLLASLPEYIILVFEYDSLEFKADKRLNIYKTLEKYGQLVEFERAPMADLIPWIKRRFRAREKSIDTPECEYLVFLCSPLMTNLVTEIDKIAAGTAGERITRESIDALASRVLEAEIFSLTDCLVQRDYTRALTILRDLFAARNEPVVVLSAITRQLQRLYAARLAADSGRREEYLMKLFGFRSAYPATLLLRGASRMTLAQLRRAVLWCSETDLQIKSNIPDDRRAVELLLLRLAEDAA